MTVWIALLRGINVGGNNIIPMKALAETFTRLGLEGVKTYIASGNVLFRSGDRDPRALEKKLEKAIAKAHDCNVKVVVRTREELATLVDALPRAWKKPSPAKRYYVVFLRHAIDTEDVLERLPAKAGVEEIVYRPGTLLWSANVASITRSTVSKKLVSRPLYDDVTVRNLNTTLKLRALADAMLVTRTNPSSPRRSSSTSR
jgi:uncharacterized protein (DUF1697 family)